jgi:hypothetical protein
MFVALTALFVALGGPAQAQRLIDGKLLKKDSVTSKAIKNRTLVTRDLSRKTVRTLQRTPRGSVTEAQLANRAVTPGKLAPGAVGPAAIAASAIGSGHVADGSLNARDIARAWGRFSATFSPPIRGNTCIEAEPQNLAAERAGLDIRGDVVVVTPQANWPKESLSLTTRTSGNKSRFVLVICNVTRADVGPFTASFNYAVINVP